MWRGDPAELVAADPEGLIAWARGDELDWHDDAACADSHPDLFFPPRGASTEPAKALCASCPVVDTCLAYALDHGVKHGIWGGTSERERRRLRRDRRAADPAAEGEGPSQSVEESPTPATPPASDSLSETLGSVDASPGDDEPARLDGGSPDQRTVDWSRRDAQLSSRVDLGASSPERDGAA